MVSDTIQVGMKGEGTNMNKPKENTEYSKNTGLWLTWNLCTIFKISHDFHINIGYINNQ